MTAEEEGFKVTDRRGLEREFTEGRGPARTPPPPPGPTPSASAPPPRPGPREEPPGEADLSGLFVMFASSALIGLGAAPDPVTGAQRVDFEQAQEAIETLLLLRAKTEGNRTEQESRFLEDVLYDLQMRYVQATRRAGRPG